MESCPFCLMGINKIQTKKIYEDNKVLAVLDINPASKGHVLIFPRKHHSSTLVMSEEELNSMFNIANKISISLVKGLKAQGVNLFLANGEIAGQKIDHIILHLIPRYQGDGINFSWDSKKISEKELSDIQKSLVENLPKENIVIQKEIQKINFREEERIP